jgi:hypothetical protein
MMTNVLKEKSAKSFDGIDVCAWECSSLSVLVEASTTMMLHFRQWSPGNFTRTLRRASGSQEAVLEGLEQAVERVSRAVHCLAHRSHSPTAQASALIRKISGND